MDDARIWDFEERLWKAEDAFYRENVDPACVMALPTPPFVAAGDEAVRAVVGTPRWSSVQFDDRAVTRPQEGLIVIGYTVTAKDGQQSWKAHCTSVYRRQGHEDWTVIQHAQVPAT